MVHAGCAFLPAFTRWGHGTSGSFESVWWNACVHRLDLALYSHLKEFWGNGVKTYVNSKRKVPSPRGGSNPWHCIKQDREPNTLAMSYCGPQCMTLNNIVSCWRFTEADEQGCGFCWWRRTDPGGGRWSGVTVPGQFFMKLSCHWFCL